MKRFYTYANSNPVWMRVLSFSLILFFVYLSDGILSFWVPNLLQDSLKSPILMGFVMSFSSLIGFAVDFTLPQAVNVVTVRRFLISGMVTGLSFSLILLLSLKLPLVVIFLLAMALWGIYYEFFGFASQQFMADTMPLSLRTSGWAIFGIFKNLAYFFGPLLAAWLVLKSEWYPAVASLIFTLIAFVFLFLVHKIHDRPFTVNLKNIDFISETEHWATLAEYVWPVITLSILIGLIDATFWTTGTVWTEELTRQNFLGSLFLPFYQLPSLFVGLVITKMHIYKGKKRLATLALMFAGIFLSLLGYVNSISLIIGLTLISSILLSIAFPLIDGIYTDIVARMGTKREHMIGLSGSTLSLAYVIGPIVAGFLADWFGEGKTFTVMGVMAIVVAGILIIFTPKKLKLPQTEISKW